MRELNDRIASAREHARPQWSIMREEHVRERVALRVQRRRVVTRVMLAAFALVPVAGLVIALVVWQRHGAADHAATSASAAAQESRTLLALSDGSVALGLTDDARVEPLEVTPGRVVVRLVRGAARFEVSHIDQREFSVQAGNVEVTVLGTIFVVDARPDSVEVRVERGRVRVDSLAGTRVLSAPESSVFDTRPLPSAPTAASQSEVAPTASAVLAVPSASAAPHHAAVVETNSWRALAKDGDYERAYSALHVSGPGSALDDPADLMLAADAARNSGHGDDAVVFLQRVVDRHRGDSRAPACAFTQGRVLLDQLGRYEEAARAFAKARTLAPGGTLAQDALAREVESWARAGNPERARERAEEYLRLFPHGQRKNTVRSYGGIE